MTPEDQARLRRQVDSLPVLPHVVSRILGLDPESSRFFDEVVGLIEAEPNFAVRLVASANSVTTRGIAPITRIRDAVVRLGARAVGGLVVSMSVVRVFVPRTDWERGLWLHALEVAHVARALVRQHATGLDPERAFLQGLLHDVGRFVMFSVAPDGLREVDEANWNTPETLLQAERATYGVDHASLGADACARWGLPSPLVDFIRHHHAPDIEAHLPGEDGRLASLVQAADLAGFSSVSGRRDIVRFVSLTVAQAEDFLRTHLPPWFRGAAGTAQSVTQALRQADELSRALGLVPRW